MKRLLETGAVAIAMALFVLANFESIANYHYIYEYGYSGTDMYGILTSYLDHDNPWYMYTPSKDFWSRYYILNTLKSGCKVANIRMKLKNERLKEQIEEEIRLGEMEMLAQLIEAEAGNQDFTGKCLVADTVLNRIDRGFGETVEEVIFADKQFSCIFDDGYDKAGWVISEDSFMAAKQEYEAKEKVDGNVLYFTANHYGDYGTPAYRHGGHYFSYK